MILTPERKAELKAQFADKLKRLADRLEKLDKKTDRVRWWNTQCELRATQAKLSRLDEMVV